MLGQLLSGQASQPRPQQQNPLGGGNSPSVDKFNALMSDPRRGAFMLNMVANLLTQQGIAQSMGRGFEGMGRFEVANNEARKAREAEAAKAAASRGGKGGGGGAAPKGGFDQKKFLELRKEIFEMLGGEDLDAGPERDEVLARATALAMEQSGAPGAAEFYNGLSEDERIEYSRDLVDPGFFMRTMEGFKQANEAYKAASIESTKGATSGMPASPEIPLPGAPTTPPAVPGGVNAPPMPAIASPMDPNITVPSMGSGAPGWYDLISRTTTSPGDNPELSVTTPEYRKKLLEEERKDRKGRNRSRTGD